MSHSGQFESHIWVAHMLHFHVTQKKTLTGIKEGSKLAWKRHDIDQKPTQNDPMNFATKKIINERDHPRAVFHTSVGHSIDSRRTFFHSLEHLRCDTPLRHSQDDGEQWGCAHRSIGPSLHRWGCLPHLCWCSVDS